MSPSHPPSSLTRRAFQTFILMMTCALTLHGCSADADPDSPVPAADMSPSPDQSMPPDMAADLAADMPDASERDMASDLAADMPGDVDASPDMPPAHDPITYHGHIKPLLNQHCMRCHVPGGQGPSDFSNVSYVIENGEWIESRVSAGEMPPPVADPTCRDYQSSEALSMSDEDRLTLKTWVQAGKPLGEDDGVKAAPPVASTFDNPDLELLLRAPYTPTYDDPANPNNEYRCFALEHGQTERFFITGMHPIIDQSAIVHHVVLAKLPRNQLPSDTTSMTGQNCIQDMGAIRNMVGAWAPGMEPISFDKAGLLIEPNEVLILQMHYYADAPENRNLADHSGYAMKIADSVKNEIQMYPFGQLGFNIPAGEANHQETVEVSLPLPITLWGVFPHMHRIGISYDMNVQISNDENVCLLDGPIYDFNNQMTYIYKEPLFIPANKQITFNCRWNNSPSNPVLAGQPISDVGYGERTDEEMCFGFSYVSFGAKVD